MMRTSMSRIAFLACVVGSALAMAFQTAPPAPRQSNQVVTPPPVQIDPPQVDFGVVSPGSKHPATFTLKNMGTQPLVINQAIPSCKCTDITPIDGKTIQPGASLTFTATLSLQRTPGVKDAKVMISFVGYKSIVAAKMVGDVTLPIRATPAYLEAQKGKTEGPILLTSVDGKPFRVISAGGKPVAPVGADGKPVPPEGAAVQTITWSIVDIPPTALQQWWVVETDRADCPLIPLRVQHAATGSAFDTQRNARWWFPPESIIIAGRVKAGQPVELGTTIEYLNPADQGRMTHPTWGDVKSITVPGGEGTMELVRVTPRGETFKDVVMKFTPAATLRGAHYIPVVIETATGRGPVFVSVTVDP